MYSNTAHSKVNISIDTGRKNLILSELYMYNFYKFAFVYFFYLRGRKGRFATIYNTMK